MYFHVISNKKVGGFFENQKWPSKSQRGRDEIARHIRISHRQPNKSIDVDDEIITYIPKSDSFEFTFSQLKPHSSTQSLMKFITHIISATDTSLVPFMYYPIHTTLHTVVRRLTNEWLTTK